jgi:hypothetical protein
LAVVLLFGVLPGVPSPRLVVDAPDAVPEELLPERDAVLVVRVLDEHGAPARGADVRVFSVVDDEAYLAADRTTDGDGLTRLERLPRGEHWVLVDAEGAARASSRLVLTPGVRELEVRLAPENTLDVAVVDDTGSPLEARIEVVGADPLPIGAQTGRDGRVTVRRLGPPPWQVVARAPGFDEVTLRRVNGGETVRLALEKLAVVTVHVQDERGGAAAGAKVLIGGAALSPARATTADAEGNARIAGLRAGSYALRATQKGAVSPIELGLLLARGEEKRITLTLAPGRVLAVRVASRDEDEPVRGARVTLAEGGLSPFPLEGVTDKSGHVALGPFAEGDAVVSARAEGFVGRSAPVPGDARELTIALARAGVVVGRVVDARGFPIGGASLELLGTDIDGAPVADDPRRWSFREAHFETLLRGPVALVPRGELGVVPGPVPPIPRASTTLLGGGASAALIARAPAPDPWITREDGTFRLEPATPGRVRVRARHPQYVEASSEAVTLAPGGTAEVRVVLRRGGVLEGRVLTEGGAPVAGVRVVLLGARGFFERSERTGSDGTFAFAAVPELVIVNVADPDDPTRVALRTSASVPDGGNQTLTLRLGPKRAPIDVRVRDDRGYPVPNAQVSAASLEAHVPLRTTAFTDKQGAASIAGASGLSVRLEVRAPGHAPAVIVLDPTTREKEITLAPAERVEGRVRDARTGDPIGGADVVLATEVGVRSAQTKPDGTFAVDDVASGKVELRVRAEGYAPAIRALSVAADKGRRANDLGVIELASEAVAEGVVVDARGDPVLGARVGKDRVPTFVAASTAPRGLAVTDARGRFRLGELPEGEVVLEAYAPDRGRGRVAITVSRRRPTSDVRIVLERPFEPTRAEQLASGGVAVTLDETSGDPRELVLVSVGEGSEAERAGLRAGDTLLDVDGVRVTTLEEGRAKLTGPIGDDVVVRVRRDGREQRMRVPREAVRR